MTGSEELTERALSVVRLARSADAAAVRAIDRAAFPAASTIKQRAAPGELEAVIDAGEAYLLEYRGSPAGYVCAEARGRDHVYISGIGVLPGMQGLGIGSRLMRHMVSVVHARYGDRPIVTITSPLNTPMVHTLFRRGFRARWALPDYFGPRAHRFGFQLARPGEPGDPGAERLVPANAVGSVFFMMRTHRLVVRNRIATALGPHYVLAAAGAREFPPTSSP